ncbi:MAG: ComEC/Rec2 family competence protein [Bdellovibrionota bacterium]
MISKALISFTGFYWGAIHQSPTPHLKENTIIQVNNAIPYSKNLLQIYLSSQNEDHKFLYFTHSSFPLPSGSIGYIHNQKSHSLVKTQQTRLQPKFSPQVRERLTFLERLSKILNNFMNTRIDNLNPKLSRWYAALTMGNYNSLSSREKDVFLMTGTMHLLVVSGLHIGFFSLLIDRVILFPAWILYLSSFLKSRYWIACKILSSLMSIILTICFVISIGFPVSAQRALIVFACHKISLIYTGALSISSRLVIAFTVQILLFPNNFISFPALLTWGAYLCILSTTQSNKTKLKNIFFPQILFTIFSVAMFARLSIVGMFLNIILVPIFPILFFFVLLDIFITLPQNTSILLGKIQLKFLDMLDKSYQISNDYPALFYDNIPLSIRLLCLAILTFIFLNYFRSISKTYI